jgi:hypothetical protein
MTESKSEIEMKCEEGGDRATTLEELSRSVRGEKWSFDFELLGWLEESGEGYGIELKMKLRSKEIFQERERKRNTRIQRIPVSCSGQEFSSGLAGATKAFSSALGLKNCQGNSTRDC